MRHLKMYRSPNEGGGATGDPASSGAKGGTTGGGADTQDVASLLEGAQKALRETRGGSEAPRQRERPRNACGKAEAVPN